MAGRTDVELGLRPSSAILMVSWRTSKGTAASGTGTASDRLGRRSRGTGHQVSGLTFVAPPRDPAVVSRDHRRGTRERDADDVPRGQAGPTLRQWSPFMIQIDGIPKPVRVVGEDRLAAGRPLAGDDPVVGADAAAASRPPPPPNPCHLGHTGRPVGERDQCRRIVLAERRHEGGFAMISGRARGRGCQPTRHRSRRPARPGAVAEDVRRRDDEGVRVATEEQLVRSRE